MSKVEAYRCDNCNTITDVEEIYGVALTQDMFDVYKSFPVVVKPETVDVHFCHECYRQSVTIHLPSDKERIKNEYDYQTKKNELSAMFRRSVVHKYNDRKHQERNRKK